VGNLLMGGSGKTPFTIFLADLLRKRGLKPAVVSRGYGGSNWAPYLVVRDDGPGGPIADPSVSGDEPYLIAEHLPGVPVVVGRMRIRPARAAIDLFGCDVIVLDDGFQHLPLKRDADIVLLNGSEDRMFPLGRLREPISALKRAHMVALVGDGTEAPRAADRYLRDLPVFRCRRIPLSLESARGSRRPEDLAGEEVFLVSGIANPERFRKTAEGLDWRVRDHLIFRDHYRFKDEELRVILALAADARLVVTEKDWVKLPAWCKENSKIAALRIGIVMDEEEAFWRALKPLISP